MKEVVWVFGTSASGKETFIRSLSQSEDVLAQFGWTSKSISICECSVRNIGQFEGDPVVKLREGIVAEVQTLLYDSDIVLVKWQFVDSISSLPQKLKRLILGARHRIIRLEAPIDELAVRLTTKPWWDDYGKENEFIKTELEAVSNCIEKLRDEFEVSVIDSGKNGKYKYLTSTL